MNSSISSFSFKRAAWTIVQLAAFLFLFDRGLSWLLNRAEAEFYRDRDYTAQFRDFVKDKSYSTLILGTSRTHEAIHPFYFRTVLGQAAYREANAGKGPRYDHYFYDFYKKCAGIPKIVVYGIDYFIFEGDSRKEWLARFGGIDPGPGFLSSPSLLLSQKKDFEYFLNDVLFRLGKRLGRSGREPSLPEFIVNQDFVGLDPKPGELGTERPAAFERLGYNKFPGKEGLYVKKLLDEWQKDGVTVLLIIIPDYYASFQTNIGRLKAMADLKRLTRDYPNVQILDFNRPRIFPLTNVEYFRDGGWGMGNSHLSRAGGEAFNRLLLEKIKPYYSGMPPAGREP